VQEQCGQVAGHLARGLAEMGPFELLTDGSELPAFAFKLREEVESFNVYDVSTRVRERGWIVPAYSFPKNRDDLHVLRVVVRNGFSRDLADLFLEDMGRGVPQLERQAKPVAGPGAASFHH